MVDAQGSSVLEPRRLLLDREPFAGIDGHIGQIDVLHAALQFEYVFLTSGRGFGKSPLALFVLLAEAGCAGMAGQVYEYAYGAPGDEGAALDTYKHHKAILRPLLSDHMGLPGGHSDTQKLLHLRPFAGNRGVVADYFGLNKHDAQRRYRKHRIVIDEFKDVPEAAYRDTLIPMRVGRKPGGILGLGSPKRVGIGVAWARSEWKRGQDPTANPFHRSFWAPSYANPYLDLAEFERTKAACKNDPLAWEEEIEGRWLEAEGAVFSNLRAVFVVPVIRAFRCGADGSFVPESDPTRQHLWIGEEPDSGTYDREPDEYAAALDLAKAPDGDFTVLKVFNRRTRREAALLRMQGILYMEQLPYVAWLLNRYGGRRCITFYDANGGHGSALTEPLCRLYGESMRGVTWSNATKGYDIAHAQNLCAQAGKDEAEGYGWTMLALDWQIAEWTEFQAKTKRADGTPLNVFQYGAPVGMHDDTVTSGCMVAGLLNRPYVSRPRTHAAKPGTARYMDEENDAGQVYVLR